MIRRLPTFKGYTIDVRLKQLRKAEIGEPLEFIDFDSEQGDAILLELIHSLDPEKKEDNELLISLF